MFYAQYNPYGSATSVGFMNTNQVYAFPTKKERDSFVSSSEDTNLSVKKIPWAIATRLAGPPDWLGKRLYLTPDSSILL